MDCRICLGYVFVHLLFTGTHCTIVKRHYVSSQNVTSSPYAVHRVTLSKRSKLECASACRDGNCCNSFSFDKKSGTCRLSSGMTENISDKVYYVTRGCPRDIGYTEWMFCDMTLCLKYMRLPLDRAAALANCARNNAHIVLINSSSMQQHVKDILIAEGADPGYVYFDGYDFDDQNIFRTWKRDELPWASWSVGNPSHSPGEDCVGGTDSDGYETRDLQCTSPRQYVCQIDLI